MTVILLPDTAHAKRRKKRKPSTPPVAVRPAVTSQASIMALPPSGSVVPAASSGIINLAGKPEGPAPQRITVVPAKALPSIKKASMTADGLMPVEWVGSIAYVRVPGGVYQVTLEKRSASGRWLPVKVEHLTGDAGQITISFTLAAAPEVDAAYRARGFTVNKFDTRPQPPSAQVQPTADELGLPTVTRNDPINTDGLIKIGAGFVGALDHTLTAVALKTADAVNTLAFGSAAAGNTATTAKDLALSSDNNLAAPVAVESDIWKFADDRLFYFNQFRGLQVIDIQNPAIPVKLGTLRLPAVGDQIQLLDPKGRHLALFTRQANSGWQSKIRIVTISESGEPTLSRTIDLNGQLGETRLIGTRLYAVLGGWWNNDQKQTTLRLQGYDLSNPEEPVDLGYAEGTGYQPVLQDAGSHLLVSTSDGSRTLIHAIYISGDGRPHLVKAVTLTGYMRDQFKMGIVAGAIVGVSEVQTRWEWGISSTITNGNQVTVNYSYTIHPAHTWIETFSLAGDSTEPLARVHLDDAEGEHLYAARFDRTRLYVVTYGVKQVGPRTVDGSYTYTLRPPCDPLFIIDLDDPAHPVVRGQLEIPGYSTFIECLGDRLLSVGREGNNVAASLFDVSDADHPSLLARVFPGAQSGYYSWSEAETEHRAVTWLRTQNKFFVPYQSWTSSGYKSATQEVNYTRDALALGEILQTEGTARRGTSVGGYLLTISGRQLVCVKDSSLAGNVSDTHVLELAWPVDHVIAIGEHLVEIEAREAPTHHYSWWNWPWYYNNSDGCRTNQRIVLRLTSREDSETVLDSVELDGDYASILSTSVRGGRLYLAQLVRNTIDWSDTTASLHTYVLKVQGNKLHQVAAAATTLPLADILVTSSIDFGRVQALWMTNEQLVWFIPCSHRQNDYWWRWPWDCFVVSDVISPANPKTEELTRRKRQSEGWGSAVSAMLCTVTIKGSAIITPSTPLQVIAAPGESMLLSTSRAFVSNGRLFFSSTQNIDFDDHEHDEEMKRSGDFARLSPYAGYKSNVLLHDIDFTEPVALSELSTTALPGALLGASSADEQGAWLLTQSGNDYYASSVLSLVYDGVKVRRKDRLTSIHGVQASDSRDGALFVPVSSQVNAYRQNQTTGKFETLASWGGLNDITNVTIRGRVLVGTGSQSVAIARINTNHTLTSLGAKLWPGYSTQLLASRTAVDPGGAGAWIPAAEYGIEWLKFDRQDSIILASGNE